MPNIIGLRRLDDTIRRIKFVGDNWLMTWASNGKVYTNLCDGRGDGTTTWNTRPYILNGSPSDVSFEFIPTFPDLIAGETPNVNRYYGFGLFAHGSNLYTYLSTPTHPFLPSGAKFCGVKLAYSPDLGKTWRNQDGSPMIYEQWHERNRSNMLFFNEPGDAFSLISVLQMGRNYEHNTDGYVYIYSPNGSIDGTMNQLAIARVPKGKVLDRASYEFLVAHNADGSAQWDTDIRRRGAAHKFPSGWVNVMYHPYAWQPCVVYYAPLGLYMMSSFGMATDSHGMWFARPSYLGFWTAKTPWGPWTQIHEDTAWTPAGDQNARCYQPQIAPHWIAPDGESFWLIWTDFQEIKGQGLPYYCFNYQKVDVLLGP